MSSEKEGKKLGLIDLMSMSIGQIIGVGIFTTMPLVLGFTGRSICWGLLLGCLLCILTSVPQAIVASLMQLPGGSYSQGLLILPKRMSGVYALLTVIPWLGFGTMPIGMAMYTMQLFPNASNLQSVLAVVYLTLFFLLGIFGPSLLSKLQNIMVLFLLIAIGVYIFSGLPHVQPGYFNPEGMFSGGASGFIAASAMLTMSCSGGVYVVNLSKEAKNPRRDVPIAMISGTIAVAVVYFLIAIITAGTVPIDQVVAGGNLGVVAESFMSRPMYLFFMIGGALFALGTTFNGMLAMFKYPWIKMAEDGWLPKVLTKTTKKRDYPWVLMLCAYIIGGILPVVFNLSIGDIIGLFSFPSYFLTTYMLFVVYRIPKKYPNSWKNSPLHMPNGVLTAFSIIGGIVEIYLCYSMFTLLGTQKSMISLAAGVVLAIVVLIRYKSGHVKVDYIDDMIAEQEAANAGPV